MILLKIAVNVYHLLVTHWLFMSCSVGGHCKNVPWPKLHLQERNDDFGGINDNKVTFFLGQVNLRIQGWRGVMLSTNSNDKK